MIKHVRLEGVLVFHPLSNDFVSIYSDVDSLCSPNYLDAPRRPIFEADFFAVPSITTINQPRADTFVAGATGLLVQTGVPAELADAVIRRYDDTEARTYVGTAAGRIANELFDEPKNAQKVLYLSLCARRP